MIRNLAAVALVLLATACGPSPAGAPGPRPEAGPLAAEVLAFEPQGYAPRAYAAISTTPIRPDAFAGWFAGAGSLENEPAERKAKPGTTYVAVTASTHCRVPESVEVTRAGTDLRVTFEGGADREECYRAVGPLAVLALPDEQLPGEQLRGVRTVNGAAPVGAGGPGRLADFVPLRAGRLPAAAAELGDTAALRSTLAAAGVDVSGAVATALERTVATGERGFAFVLTGCAETSAVLLIGHDTITADLTGGDGAVCDAPAYFLATFVADADHVPPRAELEP
jgi:hypothetical protein